jgi:hypothetical protein
MFTAGLFSTASMWSWARFLSLDGWIKKMWFIYTMEHCSAINRMRSIMCGNMDEPGGHFIKRNKSAKDKCCVFSLTCGS